MVRQETVEQERASLKSLVDAVVGGKIDCRHVNRESVLLSLVRVMWHEVREDLRGLVDAVLGCLPLR
jgi:hypothetical protein